MGGLGEHVEGMHTLQAIAGFAEVFQVAGEGAGIAGDIDDFHRVQVDECLAGFGIETGAGWIEHHQVYGFDLRNDLWQDHFNSTFVEVDILKLIQVSREIKVDTANFSFYSIIVILKTQLRVLITYK